MGTANPIVAAVAVAPTVLITSREVPRRPACVWSFCKRHDSIVGGPCVTSVWASITVASWNG